MDRTVYWILKDGMVVCSFDYDEKLIAGMRVAVPDHMKKWDKDSKTWSFNQLIWDRVCALFELHGYIVPDKPADISARIAAAESAGGTASSGPYQFLFVTNDAPLRVIEAAHKALANLYHPDRPGGDAKRMMEINNALDAIKEERSKDAVQPQ